MVCTDIDGMVADMCYIQLSLLGIPAQVMLAAAHNERDFFIPTSNYYKRLSGQFDGWLSMRVSIQWRLMFQWKDGYAERIYLDPHQDT